METLDRFQLEEQLFDELNVNLTTTWLQLSDRLKRSLILAGGFMDLVTLKANVNEIHEMLNRCPPNSPSKAAPSQRPESAKQ